MKQALHSAYKFSVFLVFRTILIIIIISLNSINYILEFYNGDAVYFL
jgi:hypothetical protein